MQCPANSTFHAGTASPRGRGRGRGRGGRGGRGGGRGGGADDNPKSQDVASDLFKIIKLIKERNYDPVIVFSFSRRCAGGVGANVHRQQIDTVWSSCEMLSEAC